jgi:carbon starvation protein
MKKLRYAWVTLAPLAWLVAVTMTASYEKIWSPDPRLGFLAQAQMLADRIASGAIPDAQVATTQRLIFNNRLDAAVTLVFAALVVLILVESGRHWWAYAVGSREPVLKEAPAQLSSLEA